MYPDYKIEVFHVFNQTMLQAAVSEAEKVFPVFIKDIVSTQEAYSAIIIPIIEAALNASPGPGIELRDEKGKTIISASFASLVEGFYRDYVAHQERVVIETNRKE